MQTKTWNRVAQFNHAFRKTSHKNYVKVLRACCAAHLKDGEAFVMALSLLEKGDYVGLVNLADSLARTVYSGAREHFLANQLALLIRKYPFPKNLVTLDPRGRALSTFMKAERRCSLQNRRMLLTSYECFDARLSRDYQFRLKSMRDFISYVLGSVDHAEIAKNCDFGAGASIGVHGNATNSARKLLAKSWTVTPEAYTLALQACWNHAQIRELILNKSVPIFEDKTKMWVKVQYCLDPLEYRKVFLGKCSFVSYNKISFVPKTVSTFRSIAVEPLLNGYLQKGIDTVMRKRLTRVGVDLSDQSKNQRMARIGSLDDSEESPCTIDLSSASDMLATEVVRDLLPEEWFELLNAVRSKKYMLDNKLHVFHKFCSMGNGFCFPLESLIFAAAVKEAGGIIGVDSLVYGDDIIVPRRIYKRTVENLSLLGFVTNKDKTFAAGPFRESCGADWFGGKDVRPFTLDFAIDSLMAYHKLRNLTKRNELTTQFFGFLESIDFGIPFHLQFKRPFSGPADTAVETSMDEFMTCKHAKFIPSIQAWQWIELLQSPVSDKEVTREERYNLALVFGAMRGASSSKPFTLRRMSHTKVRLTTGSGATSQWLPAP